MCLIAPAGLPANALLRSEGRFVVDDHAAKLPVSQTPPLTVALVNLMPDKVRTETQFARLLAQSPGSVRMVLTVPDGYATASTPASHMLRFYLPWSALDLGRVDGVIVTGAPLEHLPFQAVRYWAGMTRILDWLELARVPAMHVCWAAQAALWHYHRVPKLDLPAKRSGIYHHVPLDRRHPLLAGTTVPIPMPVSRHSETRLSDLPKDGSVRPLAIAPGAGVGLLDEAGRSATYLLNHPEYDAGTLDAEYRRDRRQDRAAALPENYYPDDDPARSPANRWAETGSALYRNWLTRVADCNPQRNPDRALDWLLFAQQHGMQHAAAAGGFRPGGIRH